MGKRIGNVSNYTAHQSIGLDFRLGVSGMPFADVWKGVCKDAKMLVFAHDIPGAFENEGTDTGEDRKFLSGRIVLFGAKQANHGRFFAVSTLDS